MTICDFCSSTKPTRDYPCADFETGRIGGTRGTVKLHSIGVWCACDDCAKFIDVGDIDGLVRRVVNKHVAKYPTVAEPGFHEYLKRSYTQFFENRIRA